MVFMVGMTLTATFILIYRPETAFAVRTIAILLFALGSIMVVEAARSLRKPNVPPEKVNVESSPAGELPTRTATALAPPADVSIAIEPRVVRMRSVLLNTSAASSPSVSAMFAVGGMLCDDWCRVREQQLLYWCGARQQA